MRTYALPKIGLVFGRVRHKILLVGFAEFRLPKGGGLRREISRGLVMRKYLTLALLALALAGGVAAFTSLNPRPALANPGCGGAGC